jgi:hypothetical protein
VTTNSCTSPSSAPEEFWNCADVTVIDGGETGSSVGFDNGALASMQPQDLRPAINAGGLAGIYSGCPLQGVGAASDYANDCGTFGQGCTGAGGEASGGSSAGGVAGPVPAPAPETASQTPAPTALSGDACVAILGNPQAATDEHCAPCATGQTWWPCNVAGLCQCGGSSTEPEPEPEPEPESAPSTEPTTSPAPAPAPQSPSPSASPAPAAVAGQAGRCAGALNGPCSACLATNDVCYAVSKSWCDARASIDFVWCEAPALVEARKARTRKHAFRGTALLQTEA